jgi:hypothetical protein
MKEIISAEAGGGWRAMPGLDAKRQPRPQRQRQLKQQQFLSPSPDDRALRQHLAGFVSMGSPRATLKTETASSSPSSSSSTSPRQSPKPKLLQRLTERTEHLNKENAYHAQVNPTEFEPRRMGRKRRKRSTTKRWSRACLRECSTWAV